MSSVINKTRQFAILAPVPEQHLISGMEALNQQLDDGHEARLAFGSNAFMLFRKADELREQCLVDIYIYASHAEDRKLNPEATWKATYIEKLTSRSGRYPGKKIHRPRSTNTDKDTWGIFWVITELENLVEPIPLGDFRGYEKKSNYSSRFFPEGPLLVEHPG